jgi:hypothetical protein
MRKLIPVLILLLLNFTSQAQSKVKRLSLKELNIGLGKTAEYARFLHEDGFIKMTPSSNLINYISVEPLGSYFAYINVIHQVRANNIVAGVGLQYVKKNGQAYKLNPIWRIGVNNASNYQLHNYWFKETKYRIDSFINSTNNQLMYKDSVYKKALTGNFYFNNFTIENAINFRTNPNKRISAYGGMGFNVGITYNRKVALNYSESISIELLRAEEKLADQLNAQSESFKLKNGTSVTIFLPVGIDYRLSKTQKHLKHTYLFYEFRFITNYRKAAEYVSNNETGNTQIAGIRVRW